MNYYVIAAILIVGFLSRLVPHAWNFTPVLSLALFSGAVLPGWQRFVVPVALMALSDCFLGFYPGIFVNWIAVAACVGVGALLSRKVSWSRLGGCSVAASVVFFVISNFGVWLSDYPKTWSGLADCYMLALPFFRSSLVSTLVYSYVLIGGYAWATRFASAKAITYKRHL